MKPVKKVLLVDDDVDILAVNSIAFEAAGFEVHVAHNSAEAVEIAKRVRPDVAILDVVMDRPDEGFALARKLRQDEKTRSMKLVLLSSINQINRSKGLAYRFSDHDRDEQWLPVEKILEKPVKPKKLIAVVESVMEGSA